jgi:DNA-binding transcriptional LysR family regulator
MRKLPPLNALRAFESAARHLSFTRAGEELSVTHGAVSRQVQALEAWLGVTLFRRLNRRVELTDAGQRYLSEIGVALDRISTASQSLRDRDAARILRVNSIPTFTMRWLIPRLSTFQMRFPRVEVRLTTSTEEIERLPDNFDVIIRGGPEIHAGFHSGRFLDESRFPVCSPALLERVPLSAPSDLHHHTLLACRICGRRMRSRSSISTCRSRRPSMGWAWRWGRPRSSPKIWARDVSSRRFRICRWSRAATTGIAPRAISAMRWCRRFVHGSRRLARCVTQT